MKEKIKQKFILKRIQKQAKAMADAPRYFKNYNDIKSVLVICDIHDIAIYEDIKSVIAQFKGDGKKVDAVFFADDDSTLKFLSNGSTATVINKENFGWNGELQDSMKTELLGYDLLINLNASPSIYLDYLTVFSDAGLKTGSSKSDAEILDFIIETGDTFKIPFLADQIKFYLRTINAK